MSAVSMKLMPVSAALSRIRCDSFSSVCFPNVPVPIHMRETVRPVLPNFVKFIESSHHLWRTLDLRKAAIHKELCSRDEACVIACQKHDCVGNLLRPPGAAEWYRGGDRFTACLTNLIASQKLVEAFCLDWT